MRWKIVEILQAEVVVFFFPVCLRLFSPLVFSFLLLSSCSLSKQPVLAPYLICMGNWVILGSYRMFNPHFEVPLHLL